MTRAEIERLEALERAATPGEWTAIVVDDESDKPRAFVDDYDCGLVTECLKTRESDGRQRCGDNARLIAATRNALPELLAMARAVVEWSDAYRACFDMTLDRESRNAVVAECRAAWDRLYRLAIADAAARGKDER